MRGTCAVWPDHVARPYPIEQAVTPRESPGVYRPGMIPGQRDQGSPVVLTLVPGRDHVRRFDAVRVLRLVSGFFRADDSRAARSGSFLPPVSRFHSSNVSLEIFPSTRS